MSGPDLLARLREIRPGLKGMLVTGNLEAVEQIRTSLPLLRKPFRIAALAEHLQALLRPTVHEGLASDGAAQNSA